MPSVKKNTRNKAKKKLNKILTMAKLGMCRNQDGKHPWSKLLSALYKVIDKKVNFQGTDFKLGDLTKA